MRRGSSAEVGSLQEYIAPFCRCLDCTRADDRFLPLVPAVWCDLFSTPQGCPSGRKCPFAHDKSELVGEAANESVSSAPSSVASSADSSFHSPELSSVSLRSSTLVNTFSPVIERPIPRFVGLLPLGPGACLNHFLKGSCANGRDCLSRHVVNSDDFACGLKPQLGPGFCLNHALSPSGCFNGVNCLNRHALSEDDYVSVRLSHPFSP